MKSAALNTATNKSKSSMRRAAFGACALLLVAAPTARAELIVGLTTANTLVSFNDTTPGTITSTVPVSGLSTGDTLVGIDRRASTGGTLYGVGVNPATSGGRIYTINPTSGAATVVTSLTTDAADTTAPTAPAGPTVVTGTTFAIDFNTVPDRLRLISNTGQNLRINVATGATQLDVPIAPATRVLSGVAYTNNFAGATTNQLFGIDTATSPDSFVLVDNPNGGTTSAPVALTGIDATTNLGYDISNSGTGFLAVQLTPTTLSSTLYRISTAGALTPVGTVGGGVPLVDIAAVPEPTSVAVIGLVATGLLARRRQRA